MGRPLIAASASATTGRDVVKEGADVAMADGEGPPLPVEPGAVAEPATLGGWASCESLPVHPERASAPMTRQAARANPDRIGKTTPPPIGPAGPRLP